MSSQRGNVSRSRPQKHQNTKVFKNTLYDKSKKTQIINSTQVTNSCDKCKAIIEWKIKYKKYKQLKSAKTCTKCSNKTVKQSYHTICGACVEKLKVCAKCGTSDLKNFSGNPAELKEITETESGARESLQGSDDESGLSEDEEESS